jgi:hypothetical protein
VRSRRKKPAGPDPAWRAGDPVGPELRAELDRPHPRRSPPHTAAPYRRDEARDELELKVDRRAADKLAEQIATDRVTLIVRHFNFYEVVLNEITAALKAGRRKFSVGDLAALVAVIEKARKGQRLARALSLDG